MNYLDQLTQVIVFIEENLNQKLTVEEIAGVAGYSYFHFQRVFQAVIGESLGSYLRKRRLTEAAQALLFTERRILDIAVDYQFESQEAFNRSFKRLYGVTPGQYRKNGIHQYLGSKKFLTPDRLEHLQDGVTIQPVIRVIPSRKIVGVRGATSISDNRLPQLWAAFRGRMDEVRDKREPLRLYGVCEVQPDFDMTLLSEESTFTDLVGVEVQADVSYIPPGMDARVISEGKYAVFTHRGPLDRLGITYEYIWGTWVPNCGQELDLRDDFELYDERFLGPDNEDSELDIYIPLK